MNLFSKLKDGLSKTRTQINSILGMENSFTDSFYAALEDALVSADVGIDLSEEIIQRLKQTIKSRNIATTVQAISVLKQQLVEDMHIIKYPDEFPPKPWVILIIGVNGVGKTTTIAKIGKEFRDNGKKVMFGAADTFRAGAIEQLRIWAQRVGADFISQHEGADSASVAFDALEAAKARDVDTLLLDTAGRLHNKANLMSELEKIVRVLKRNTSHTPNEILLVVDATTGQNALKQMEVFHSALGISGLIITKLDGTAKGGIALALTRRFGIPIRNIGVGEGMDDLQEFNPVTYVDAMFGDYKPQ